MFTFNLHCLLFNWIIKSALFILIYLLHPFFPSLSYILIFLAVLSSEPNFTFSGVGEQEGIRHCAQCFLFDISLRITLGAQRIIGGSCNRSKLATPIPRVQGFFFYFSEAQFVIFPLIDGFSCFSHY